MNIKTKTSAKNHPTLQYIFEHHIDSVELVFFLHDIIRRMESTPTTPENPLENNDTVVFKRSHFYSVMVTFAFLTNVIVRGRMTRVVTGGKKLMFFPGAATW